MGVGKSEFSKRLAIALSGTVLLEKPSDNKSFAPYYEDVKKSPGYTPWAIRSQSHFLAERLRQLPDINDRTKPLILDRTVCEDGEVFARTLYRENRINQEEFDHIYTIFYSAIVEVLPRPDLIVFLNASFETLLQRIKGRGREEEKNLDLDYLRSLGSGYDEWRANFDLVPMMTIETDRFNVFNAAEFETEVGKIRQKLTSLRNVA